MDCLLVEQGKRALVWMTSSLYDLWHHKSRIWKEKKWKALEPPTWPATYAPICAKCCFFRGHFAIMKSFPTTINRGAFYSKKLENLTKLLQNFSLKFSSQIRTSPKLQEKNFYDPNFNSSYRPHQITQEKPKSWIETLNP